jgi:hypothetical protein
LREKTAKWRRRSAAAASSGGSASARAREGSTRTVGARWKSACKPSNQRSAAPYGEAEEELVGRPRAHCRTATHCHRAHHRRVRGRRDGHGHGPWSLMVAMAEVEVVAATMFDEMPLK